MGTSQIDYKLVTRTGSKFFLKEKRSYVTDEHFRFHLLLQNYVYEQKGPVAKICKTSSGRLWAQFEERKFELQKWIEGNPVILPTLSDLEQMGEVLALLHISMKDFKSKHYGRWDFPTNRSYLCPERWSEIPNYARFLTGLHIGNEKRDKALLESINRLIRKKGQVIQLAGLAQQYIHGDFDRLNCIKTSSGEVIVVDLDLAHWGCRLSDLTFAIAKICGIEYSPPSFYCIGKKWRTDLADKMVSGYEHILPLSDYEKKCFHSFLVLNMVRTFVDCFDLDSADSVQPNDLSEQEGKLWNMLEDIASSPW